MGATKWPCYIQTPVITRYVIKGLPFTYILEKFPEPTRSGHYYIWTALEDSPLLLHRQSTNYHCNLANQNHKINSLHAGYVFMLLLSADFLKKNISKTLSECQTAWIQIRTDILSVLIWVQAVCKSYQQTTKVSISKEKFQHTVSALSNAQNTQKGFLALRIFRLPWSQLLWILLKYCHSKVKTQWQRKVFLRI